MLMILALSGATSAFADGSGTLTPNIDAGSLSVVNNGSATITSTLNLDGTDKSLTIAVPLTVTDATGSGAGWHMSIFATQFHTAADSSPYRTIPDTATTYTGMDTNSGHQVQCGSDSTCSLPTNNKSTGTTIPTEDVTTDGTTLTFGSATPLSFYNAATNTGMGVVNLQPDFSVSLAANVTYVGAYSSDITITVSANP